MKKTRSLWIALTIAVFAIGSAQAMDMIVPDLSVIKVAEGDIYDRTLIWNNVDEMPNEVPGTISPESEDNEPNPLPLAAISAGLSIGDNKPVPGLIVPGGDSLTGMVGPRSIVVSSPRQNADREIRYLIRTLN